MYMVLNVVITGGLVLSRLILWVKMRSVYFL